MFPTPALLPLSLALFAAGGSAPAHEVPAWTFDPLHSQVVFFVDHLGFAKAIGRARVGEGRLQFDPDDWSTASVDVSVALDTLDMGDAKWTATVLSGQFLDAARWPLARFRSTSVERTDGRPRARCCRCTGTSTDPRATSTASAPIRTHSAAAVSARRRPRPPLRHQRYRDVVSASINCASVEALRLKPTNPRRKRKWHGEVTGWGAAAKGLHWLMALGIIGAGDLGLVMTGWTSGKINALVHKSIGLTVLALFVLRLAWRFFDRRPADLPMPRLQRIAARAVRHPLPHAGDPADGWLYNSARDIRCDGSIVQPAALVAKNEGLPSSRSLPSAVLDPRRLVAHVGGALLHHFFERDDTLRRMLPFTPAPSPSENPHDPPFHACLLSRRRTRAARIRRRLQRRREQHARLHRRLPGREVQRQLPQFRGRDCL